VRAQDLLGRLVAGGEDALDLGVGGGGGGVGAVHGGGAVEIGIRDGRERHEAEAFGHAVLRDHLPRELGRALDVVGGARRLDAEDDLLGGAAAQQRLQLDQELFLGVEEFFFLRHLHGVAQRTGGVRDNGDLGDRLRVFLQGGNQRVADFMVGDNALFGVGQHGALLFGARDDDLEGGQQILLVDGLAAQPHGAQRRLVHEVGQIRADGAGGGLRDLVQIDVLGELDVLGVHAQRLVAALQVRTVNDDAAVETARAQQRLVEDLGPVGGREDDDALGGVEAVDFGEQLVERLLALVIAAEAAVARAADGVDLVDEDDGGGDLRGLLEQIAHAAGADAHEHLHEVGAGDREERHVGLAGDRLGEQGLARARRADEQHAMRNLGAHPLVALGFSQEVSDLLELLDGLVDTRHVGELDLRSFLLGGEGLRLAKLHGPAVLVGHATHVVHEDAHEEYGGHHRDENRLEDARRRGVDLVRDLGMLGHELGKGVGAHVDALVLHEGVRVARIVVRPPVRARDAAVLGLERDRGDAIVLHGGHELVGGKRIGARVGRERVDAHREREVHHDGHEHERGDERRLLGLGAAVAVAGRRELVKWFLVWHGS